MPAGTVPRPPQCGHGSIPSRPVRPVPWHGRHALTSRRPRGIGHRPGGGSGRDADPPAGTDRIARGRTRSAATVRPGTRPTHPRPRQAPPASAHARHPSAASTMERPPSRYPRSVTHSAETLPPSPRNYRLPAFVLRIETAYCGRITSPWGSPIHKERSARVYRTAWLHSLPHWHLTGWHTCSGSQG